MNETSLRPVLVPGSGEVLERHTISTEILCGDGEEIKAEIAVQREKVVMKMADNLSLNPEVRRELVCAIMILG